MKGALTIVLFFAIYGVSTAGILTGYQGKISTVKSNLYYFYNETTKEDVGQKTILPTEFRLNVHKKWLVIKDSDGKEARYELTDKVIITNKPEMFVVNTKTGKKIFFSKDGFVIEALVDGKSNNVYSCKQFVEEEFQLNDKRWKEMKEVFTDLPGIL